MRWHFGADPGVIGRTLRINGRPHRIVGILPAGFRFLSSLLGWAGAWAESRAMQGVLLDIPAIPAAILAVTAIVLSAVALVACFVPAARAARLSPTEALAGE
ncbi:MAG TPA: hypothetical protein VND92_02725 [Vicinamibacterales bacterium]|nr:hypothetical protein [Vicinamibacterales bacterium]